MDLPKEFLEMLEASGNDKLRLLANVLCTPSATTAIRLNPAKGGEVPANGSQIPWCDWGYYLDSRPQFIFDPALHQGLYYVQDASSMAHCAAVEKAVELIGNPGRPLRYLDACAAPGGKTTGAIDVLPENSFIVANEFDPRRSSILIENLAKWGCENVVITREDATKMRPADNFFDIIAADVPCSGEGMMRKEQQAVAQWSPALVAECAARQKLIVDNLWQSLRPGGVFVYSTCTFNLDENEHIVRHIIDELGGEAIEIEKLNRPEIIGSIDDDFPCYRFLPGEVDGEGQFIALIRKPDDESYNENLKFKGKGIKELKDFKGLLQGDWTYFADKDASVRALRKEHTLLADYISSKWYALSIGVETGIQKGRDFIPAQALALARSLRSDAFPTAEIDLETAIEYLRRNAITIEAPTGIILLTYKGKALGFVKNLGKRANNLYPAQWRILSTH